MHGHEPLYLSAPMENSSLLRGQIVIIILHSYSYLIISYQCLESFVSGLSGWLSVRQIAEYLGISMITVYRWIEAGKIPCHRVGHQWRFSTTEIDQWVLSGNASDLEKKMSKTNKRNKISEIKEEAST